MDQNLINTDKYSAILRPKTVDIDKQRILISNYKGTEQESDLQEPPTCNGFGRIRHFRRTAFSDWPNNPLPIDPASKALHLGDNEELTAQVFQSASCNWRCWYCFVPFQLLAGNQKYSGWLSCDELLDCYLELDVRPKMIDLTGGQPDLVPEWVPWMMRAIKRRKLENEIYLWSDDNLSTDYFWKYLSEKDIELISSYKNYGRVCCFKGFDNESFSLNTRAEPELFNRQFELMSKLLNLKIDIYAYVTFTCLDTRNLEEKIKSFIDGLQSINEKLPLRMVPLKVLEFNPVRSRIKPEHHIALDNQYAVVDAWIREIGNRFISEDRDSNIADVQLF